MGQIDVTLCSEKLNFIKYRQLIHRIKKQKLSYETLTEYYEFLYYGERTFYINGSMYISPLRYMIYDDKWKGIIIDKTKNSDSEIIIYPDHIHLNIRRHLGHQISSNAEFYFDKLNENGIHDRYILRILLKLIKKEIIAMIKSIYKNKI